MRRGTREGRLADNKALRVVSPASPSRLATANVPPRVDFRVFSRDTTLGPGRRAEGAGKGVEERARAHQKHGRSNLAFKYLRIRYLQTPEVYLIRHGDNNGEAFMSA
jgi:hypothetical protein